MANSPEELREAAHRSRLLALQAKDPEQQAKLFAMADDIERQAIEAEIAASNEEAALVAEVPLAESRVGIQKRRWFRRRHKLK